MEQHVFRPMTEPEIGVWYREELCEAFAENERKPLPDILALLQAGRYELWGLFEGEQMLGYAGLWKGPGIPLVLLDYLGVTARLRSRGLGAEILARLRSMGRPLVAEAELPTAEGSAAENDLRRRRIAFYRRNGFTPAYEMATCGMRWQALLSGAEELAPEDVTAWHRALYGPERTDVQVPLPPGAEIAPPYWMA